MIVIIKIETFLQSFLQDLLIQQDKNANFPHQKDDNYSNAHESYSHVPYSYALLFFYLSFQENIRTEHFGVLIKCDTDVLCHLG